MPRVRSASGLMISIGPDLVGEVGEIGRLVARAGADLEHLLAELHVDRRGHAADDVRAGDGHAVADVEEGVLVGAAEVLLERELLARRQQEGALVAVVEHVAVGDQRLEAAEALRAGNAGSSPRFATIHLTNASRVAVGRRRRPSCRAWARPRPTTAGTAPARAAAEEVRKVRRRKRVHPYVAVDRIGPRHEFPGNLGQRRRRRCGSWTT